MRFFVAATPGVDEARVRGGEGQGSDGQVLLCHIVGQRRGLSRSAGAWQSRPQQPLRQHRLQIMAPASDQHHMHRTAFDAIDQPRGLEQRLPVGLDAQRKQLFGVAAAFGHLVQALHDAHQLIEPAVRAGGIAELGEVAVQRSLITAASAPRYQSVTRQRWTEVKGCGIDCGGARRDASSILSASLLP